MGYEAPAIRKLGSIAESTEWWRWWKQGSNQVQGSPVNQPPPVDL